ncbi:MAG: aldose 1-epimerase family protein [Candidatus Atribacteria bacterium]|nr:aldose 1-epimerase family protein [Candidatus Atribacteria bacterium]
MAFIYNREMTREEILKRVGDISQIGGVILSELQDGPERGNRTAQIITGGGLHYTVLLDRGMDLAWTWFKGMAISWRSATQAVAPYYFEPADFGWLRGFHGGLMNTCGLTYFGSPNHDPATGQNLGLHGRASYTPAKNIYADGAWQGDDYQMWVQGKIREASVFGDKLVLYRKIWSRLGEKTIYIEDEVVNEGWSESPFMILYHINVGFPLLDEGSKLYIPAEKTIPRTPEAEKGLSEWNIFHTPQKNYFEQVFFHTPKVLHDGYSAALLHNEKLTLGLYVKFKKETLPFLTEWKMIGEGEYVLGIEPGNSLPEGRPKEREAGRLVTLGPGESRKMVLEIGIVEGSKEIDQFKKYMGTL